MRQGGRNSRGEEQDRGTRAGEEKKKEVGREKDRDREGAVEMDSLVGLCQPGPAGLSRALASPITAGPVGLCRALSGSVQPCRPKAVCKA